MVSERMRAATIAGIDLQIQEIKKSYSRIIQRELTTVEQTVCVKLTEIYDGNTYLICIAAPKFASRCLMGWMEELELKEER